MSIYNCFPLVIHGKYKFDGNDTMPINQFHYEEKKFSIAHLNNYTG